MPWWLAIPLACEMSKGLNLIWHVQKMMKFFQADADCMAEACMIMLTGSAGLQSPFTVRM